MIRIDDVIGFLEKEQKKLGPLNNLSDQDLHYWTDLRNIIKALKKRRKNVKPM